MKFRKKPVEVEAIQLTKELALQYFRDGKLIFDKFSFNGQYHLEDKIVWDAYIMIDTLEGRMKASLNDWIIKGVNGEFYPCKPDIFEKTYEPVTPSHPIEEATK